MQTLSLKKHQQLTWRNFKDLSTRYLTAWGGVSIILALILIGFYLFYVVLPLFKPASAKTINTYSVPGGDIGRSVYYAIEEQNEVGFRLTDRAQGVFFSAHTGESIAEFTIPLPPDIAISSVTSGNPTTRIIGLGLTNGTVLLIQHNYQISYPSDQRLISPVLDYPLGQTPIVLDQQGKAIKQLAVQSFEGETTIVAYNEDGKLLMSYFVVPEFSLSDEVTLERTDLDLTPMIGTPRLKILRLNLDMTYFYLADEKEFIYFIDISNKSQPRLLQEVKASTPDNPIISMELLSGGISILAGHLNGKITRWFPLRDKDNNYTLAQTFDFTAQSESIMSIVPEYFRKGFVAIDKTGEVVLYHTTAKRWSRLKHLDISNPRIAAISPRANGLLLEHDESELMFLYIDNPHPEISWHSLWQKVWYESRDRPHYIWQSSAAHSDFEPKFNLTPLLFGTAKAIFYALLFAIPIAILGAMYTAYFMAPTVRAFVKPTIEIMEALPTVILGFLAGLWLAPFIEKHLPSVFLFPLLSITMILLASTLWGGVPKSIKHWLPEGWEAVLLVPVIIIAGWLSVTLSMPLENLFFGGNMPLWLTQHLGISYDQRNSLVVGLAMGFAVIPTIFSISEDAIYSVPRHLVSGSLALGATRWQTLIRIVLLTASPGIFSAVMIGLGRAVGETMIVVMATGNTAIMDMNIFEGFRALSANIAVEMPESEIGSTHYRILFLAALVLFLLTFLFNTIAEIVRQRLRVKYGSL